MLNELRLLVEYCVLYFAGFHFISILFFFLLENVRYFKSILLKEETHTLSTKTSQIRFGTVEKMFLFMFFFHLSSQLKRREKNEL